MTQTLIPLIPLLLAIPFIPFLVREEWERQKTEKKIEEWAKERREKRMMQYRQWQKKMSSEKGNAHPRKYGKNGS